MSEIYTQDWEAAPSGDWSTGGVNIARTSTSPMDGSWDIRLATTAGGGTWTFTWPPTGSARGAGSARGCLVQARFKFKFETATPVTGTQVSLMRGGTAQGLFINDGSFKLCLQGQDLSQTLGGTTLVQNQEYLIDVEFRYERDDGVYFRAWLDGTLEVTHRDGAGSAPSGGGVSFLTGGIAGGKGTSTCRWGDIKIWAGNDPT